MMSKENNDIAIKVSGLSKSFKLPHEKHDSIKSMTLNFKKSRTYEVQRVLKDINFEVKKGEFFGIVGRNGSGKSTLLKCIAGVYSPTEGSVSINGSLVPFIELGVGFNPELSGRDNIFLNGALLGFSRKQMEDMYDEIVEFAELEKFMDQKLKNYSSGMQVRLAFSIAIQAKGDILVLDEVLAVGDSSFQKKCFDYFEDLKNEKKTVILVSHNMAQIEKFCTNGILLENGNISMAGTSLEIGQRYEKIFLDERAEKLHNDQKKKQKFQETMQVKKVEILQSGKKSKDIDANKDFSISVTLKSGLNIDKANIGFNIKNEDGVVVLSSDTNVKVGPLQLVEGEDISVEFKIKNIYTNGLYSINLGVSDCSKRIPETVFRMENAQQIVIYGIEEHIGSLTHTDIEISVEQ